MIRKHIENFDLCQIAESGQCFRMRMQDENTAVVVAGNKILHVFNAGEEEFEFCCDQKEFESFWYDYFDLGSDYGAYIDSIDRSDDFLLRAAGYGRGIRILRQDPFETLISFIISQRKNIPAIQASVDKLCRTCGEKIAKDTYAFPTPEAIAGLSEEELKSCSLGYRAPYVSETAKRVASGETDPEALREYNDEELLSELLSFYGVGKKVASCVMLFAYHRTASFPVDVWIQRVMDEHYHGRFPVEKYPGYAGILQQYMFFYARR